MEVLLIRHSRTAGNIARRYSGGGTDEPLCEEGIELARRSGIDTKTASVYVSPMKRALETAAIKFPNAALTVCADLREMDFGDFEGRTADDMANDPAYTQWLETNCMGRCPNGEGIPDFTHRVCRAFDTLVRECIDNGDSRLIIVAHGGTIMSILSTYGRPEKSYYDWYADNCCGYRARLDEKAWTRDPILTDCSRFETLEC